MNIRFVYLYRDAGNFKNWGSVVFANPRDFNPGRLTEKANTFLFAENNFNAERAGVPDLHFPDHDYDLDHEGHEVYAFESTDEVPNDLHGRGIDTFLKSLRSASEIKLSRDLWLTPEANIPTPLPPPASADPRLERRVPNCHRKSHATPPGN